MDIKKLGLACIAITVTLGGCDGLEKKLNVDLEQINVSINTVKGDVHKNRQQIDTMQKDIDKILNRC